MKIHRLLWLAVFSQGAISATVSVAEYAPFWRLSSQNLSIAIVAKDEFRRRTGNSNFTMYVRERDDTYMVDFPALNYRYSSAVLPPPWGCDDGSMVCYRIVLGADLHVIESRWTAPLETTDELRLDGQLPF